MKKLLIAAFVGAIILFAWGYIAWMVLPLHHHTMNYTPAQDEVLSVLGANGTETGAYMLPMADNRTAGFYDKEYKAAAKRLHETTANMPFAMLIYNKKGMGESMMQMFIFGFLLSFVIIFVVSFVFSLAQDRLTSFFQRWWFFLLIGLIIVLQGPLFEWNYMGFPWPYIQNIVIDTLLSYGLVGIWLAWYLPKKA